MIGHPDYFHLLTFSRNYHDTACVLSVGGQPMSRLTVFTVFLLVLVAIGSQSRNEGSLNKSLQSICVCMPARVGLIMKSAIAKTQAKVQAAERFTSKAASAVE